MTLSILCITNAEPHATKYIALMSQLAERLSAEFVLGLDGKRAQRSDLCQLADTAIRLKPHDVPLQECVMDDAVTACTGAYILRLDDDEVVSPALEKWLAAKEYEKANLYSFPRVYMHPDEKHILCNDHIYPDLQTRLGKKELMYGVTFIHAGNPNGPGTIAPYAIEHHKLLCRSYVDRQAIATRYEAIRQGAGSLPEYARYNLPEMIYNRLEVKEYTDGDYS